MLLHHTARPDKVHRNATTPTKHVSANLHSVATIAASRPDLPAIPFARFPHALAGDTRLSPTDRLIGAALLFWARDRSTATMSNRSLARYLGVSLSVVERGLRALARLGYIVCESIRATVANATGRVVHLAWVEDPSVLPPALSRLDLEVSGGEGISSATGGRFSRPERGVVSGKGAHQGTSPATGGLVAAGEEVTSPATEGASSEATEKEDRVVKKPENPENARTDAEERQRSQADLEVIPQDQVEQPAEPSTTIPEAEVVAAPAPADPLPMPWTTDVLTTGQRDALAAMSADQRRAFDAKSPGTRAQILAPFASGFEPKLFERVTTAQLAVPRHVAQARPVDRSTPGLVATVASGDPRFIGELAEALCRDLGGAGDRRRWGALFSLAGQVLGREVSAEAVLDALRQAKGPKAKNPGAVFTHALKAHGWRPGSGNN